MLIETLLTLLPNRTVWVMQTPNCFDGDYTLLISKVSEAILPDCTLHIVRHSGAIPSVFNGIVVKLKSQCRFHILRLMETMGSTGLSMARTIIFFWA